jgi:FHA domain-containing protein
MPALTLQVVSIDAVPVAQSTVRAFDSSGGSIGRDDTNFFALPDKHRRVSRLHATISFPGGMPTITNSSTSLPLSVGEQQLDGGESLPITQGALIEIGPYVLMAHVSAPAPTLHEQPPRRTALQDINSLSPAVGVLPIGDDLRAIDPLSLWTSDLGGNQSPVPSVAPLARIGAAGLLPEASQTDLEMHSALRPPATPPAFSDQSTGSGRVIDSSAASVDPFADLLVGIGGTASPASSPVSAPISKPTAQSGLSADPLAAFGAVSPAQGDTFLGGAHSRQTSAGGASKATLPDDFNPFHMPSGASRNAADPLAGLLGANPSNDARTAGTNVTPSIDSLFQTGESGAADADLFGIAPTARTGDNSLNLLLRSNANSDPMALFESADTAEPVSRPMRDDRSEIGSAFSPPLPNRPHLPEWPGADSAKLPAVNVPAPPAYLAAPPHIPTVAPTIAARPVIPATASLPIAAPDTLTEAFLRGAGLAPSALPNGLTPEIMTVIGSLLRSATAGAVDMLAARAATKREVQASVTIISVQANNPLKFLPNADSALLQLLGKKMPGFMRADVAMRDAFDDLRAHEVGVIAGTRAALTEVLGKFDPAVLGDKLARGSVLESVMPSARKAKLWDLYLERYLQIRREAEDDFQSIFGRAFVQAYERETARIKGESPMAGGE